MRDPAYALFRGVFWKPRNADSVFSKEFAQEKETVQYYLLVEHWVCLFDPVLAVGNMRSNSGVEDSDLGAWCVFACGPASKQPLSELSLCVADCVSIAASIG